MKKIVIFSNTAWSIINFRKELVLELSKKNKIYIVTPKDVYSKKLQDISNNIITLNFKRFSVNPIHDMYLFIRFFIFAFYTKPDLIMNFTIKPVIYGAITSRILNIKCINTITGLGRIFYPIWKDNLIRNIVIFLYRFSHKKVCKIFF